jgi:hypothetical protein
MGSALTCEKLFPALVTSLRRNARLKQAAGKSSAGSSGLLRLDERARLG